MKRILCVLILSLILVLPAAAQREEWQVNFREDFDSNEFGWPLGAESQGNLNVERRIQDSAYVWNVTTSDPNVVWMRLNPGYPEAAARYRFSTEVRLPDFDPLACGGLLLDGNGDTFYSFVVCNDKTYSLQRNTNGNMEILIPYSPIKDYDSFKAAAISAEINNGWVDLYYGDTSLDTFNIGFTEGSWGLIAMPQSTSPTEFAFGNLVFESTLTEAETTFDASAVDPNAPDSISRTVKMLNMKERISSTAGTYTPLPEKNIALAMMGYSAKEPLIPSARNMLLISDVQWASGYERPDYGMSGCGFYIRGQGSDSYVEIYAAMDGAVHVNGIRYGVLVPLIDLKYGNWNIEGGGRLAVAADEGKITILWNDSILGTITDGSWRGEGDAGYVIHSGTNGDFGTRCTFTNGEAYIFSGD